MDDNGNSWVEKYRPETWEDIQGHNTHLKEIQNWAEHWTTGDDALLLVGPPGVGKTTTAYVAANEMGYPLQEINASSSRDQSAVDTITASIRSTPSDADHQFILFDEVDSYHHSTDTKKLADALSNPANPVIMTANSKYDVPDPMKRASRMKEYSLGKRSREAKLRQIAKAEDVEVKEADISDLAERPDLRSAINDLQSWAQDDIPPADDERVWEEGAFDAMEKILRGEPDLGYGETPDNMVIWLDENVKKEYRGLEATIAYDCIRMADKYAGYAQSSRNYTYWKYANSLLEQVARVRLTETHDYYINMDFPQWFRASTPNPSGDSPTARVYQKLKDTDGGTFQFGGDYTYFRRVLLPLIKRNPVEKRKKLAVNNGLDRDEVEVIGLSKDDFDRWTDDEVPESRVVEESRIKQDSAMSW